MAEERKVKFSVAIRSDKYKELINNTLGEPNIAKRFVAEISTLVGNNSKLQECDAKTIISAGLLAQSLNLPLAPTLGFCYIIPYGGSATFQIGWKGLVQLAIRTRAYKTLGVNVVHEGEYIGRNKFGEPVIEYKEECSNKPVIGYHAYFELTNGFVKEIYWTKEMCEAHAKRYSVEYKSKGTGKWVEMFDEMSMKTVIKQLISKWGIMSTELMTAVEADQAVVKENGKYDYIDNDNSEEKDDVKTDVTNSIEDTEGE